MTSKKIIQGFLLFNILIIIYGYWVGFTKSFWWDELLSIHYAKEISNLNKAMSLGYYELFDRAESINDESNKYRMIEPSQVSELARSLFRESNSNVLFYKSTKNAG